MGMNAEIVKGLYEAFARGDVPAVLGAMDPKIEWREAESFRLAAGNPYVGPMAVAGGVFQPLVTEIEGFAAVPRAFIDGGDTVVVEGRYQGKVKATGAVIDAPFAHVYRLRGGKITAFQQYTDTAHWARTWA